MTPENGDQEIQMATVMAEAFFQAGDTEGYARSEEPRWMAKISWKCPCGHLQRNVLLNQPGCLPEPMRVELKCEVCGQVSAVIPWIPEAEIEHVDAGHSDGQRTGRGTRTGGGTASPAGGIPESGSSEIYFGGT